MLDRVSPPYDVISAEELGRLRANRFNVTNITLGGVDGDYSAAGLALSSWIEQGALAQDRRDAFYTYRQTFCEGEHYWQRTGIVGIMAAEGYSERVVPHEETFPQVKEDRLNLLRGTGTHCESIFGIFDELSPGLRDRMDEVETKVLEFTDPQGVRHCLFRVCDPETVAAVSQELAGKTVLIADGHHRYETALNYRDEMRAQHPDAPANAAFNYGLVTFVSMSDPGLVILPTHRLIYGYTRMQSQALLEALASYFEVKVLPTREALEAELAQAIPEQPRFGFYDGTYTLLTLKTLDIMTQLVPDRAPSWRALDVAILHELIIEHIMGLSKGSVARKENLDYLRDPNPGYERVDRGEANFLFLLNGTRMEHVRACTEAGEKMPQKSTDFYPKVLSGLVALPLYGAIE